MPISFQDKVVVITGAGRGLGKSYALFLASRGAKVVVNDIGVADDESGQEQKTAHKVVKEIRAKGGKAEASCYNVAEPHEAARIIEDAVSHFGTIDILINNAGILRDKTFLKLSREAFDHVLKVNLGGTVEATRAAFPIMQAKGYGRIVMTTSTAGLFGNFGQTNYSTAKMGLVGFMNSLKLEGRKYGILVNTVSPFAVTPLAISIGGVFPDETAIFLKPEMVTPIVAYLCSDSCQTSGNIILAGGGFFAAAQVLEGPGIRFDPGAEVTPEIIAENYDSILNMKGAVPFESVKEELATSIGPLMRRS